MKRQLKKKDTGFTQIKNEVLKNKELSLIAKGLFCYLYSKPLDWDFSYKRIALEMKESANTIAKYLRELETHGYLERQRLTSGRMNYYITFEPQPKIATTQNSQGGKFGTISNKDINTNKEGRGEKPTSQNYLRNLPDEDVKELTEKYKCSPYQVKSKADDIVNYCESKETTYKNYKAILRIWIKKDFGILTKEDKENKKRIEATKKKINQDSLKKYSKMKKGFSLI